MRGDDSVRWVRQEVHSETLLVTRLRYELRPGIRLNWSQETLEEIWLTSDLGEWTMESVWPEEELGTLLFASPGRCSMMTYRYCCSDITPCPLSLPLTPTTIDQTAWQPERHSLGLPSEWTSGLTTYLLVAGGYGRGGALSLRAVKSPGLRSLLCPYPKPLGDSHQMPAYTSWV